jgi:hypothetical protein
MYEQKEVVNMVATIAFLIYFFYLVRKGKCSRIPEIWLSGVFLISISNISTVAEGFWLPVFFNFLEHFSFTIACLLFLIGTIQLKYEKTT